MTFLQRRTFLGVASAFALPAPAIRAQGSTGVALVIGNSKYQWEASLPNVKRDVPDIARRFQACGLQTELLQDLGRADMHRAIDKWLQASRGANLAALYFAGHGVVVGRANYLVPADADLSDPKAVETLIGLGKIRAGLGGASHNLLVLDACRNNPADGWRQREALDQAVGGGSQGGNGAPRNSMVLFSTAPGRVALDGPAGQNSPFAASLLRQFEKGTVDLQALPTNVRRDLLMATKGRQLLWSNSSYDQPFMITGKPEAARGGTGGWASDPSNIVELPNAYAYAQQSGLVIPAGLIAHRAPAGSRDATKVGAFKYTSYDRLPAMLIVISVEEQQTAEIVMANRAASGQTGWRFIQARLSGDTIEYTNMDGGRRYVCKWSDASKGSIAMFSSQQGQGNGIVNAAFTRLDG
jgi:hypothetical protein